MTNGRCGVAGAIGVLLAIPPAVLGVLFMAEMDADGGSARDVWEQALMAASALFALAVHVCALLALLRESRRRGGAGASER
ncbi:hypothetical protein [Variovorax sp. RA8]|uniref:hypothetical protein n=1 Tax=Variovorax sp. (strain JCM 16519 / RA8) TaxID=662548 RepID=UPI00131810C1|nr:hypothetical protein [Variovorax sp. RA8]VTU37179.1 hypothetical protein RA8CHR_05657 [Variovorax sp. RA8]